MVRSSPEGCTYSSALQLTLNRFLEGLYQPIKAEAADVGGHEDARPLDVDRLSFVVVVKPPLGEEMQQQRKHLLGAPFRLVQQNYRVGA